MARNIPMAVSEHLMRDWRVRMRVSVWVDQSGSELMGDLQAHIEALQALDITRCCVMINHHREAKWRLRRWNKGWLFRLGEALRDAGIGMTITTWARPNRAYLDAMAEVLPDLADDLGADIELDLEGQWCDTAARAAGWELAEAEEYLLGCLRPAPTSWRLCLTSAYVRPQARLAVRCDEVALQCYSYCTPKEPERDWGRWAGPGSYQEMGVSRMRERMPHQAHVMGLAAFSQAYPGHTVREALREAWDACAMRNIPEVRYWSWTWIVGPTGRKIGSVYRFLEEKEDTQ